MPCQYTEYSIAYALRKPGYKQCRTHQKPPILEENPPSQLQNQDDIDYIFEGDKGCIPISTIGKPNTAVSIR